MAENVQEKVIIEEDTWTLSPEQMFFMIEHHNLMTEAYALEDMNTLRNLAKSEAYLAIFADMSFDEAYDRYETILEGDVAQAKSF